MKKAFYALLFLFSYEFSTAQVGVNANNAAPDSSAMLDVSSTSKGLLLPRMTKAQRDSIASPATGLFIYQTDTLVGLYTYNGSAWVPVSDNLGNHTATMALNMGSFRIYNTNASTGLRIDQSGGLSIRSLNSLGGLLVPTITTYFDNDGGFYFKGSLGAGIIPMSGSGTRAMWYPFKGGIRAGGVDGVQWDDANFGFYSAAFGSNSIASATYSFAAGGNTSATNIGAFAVGVNSVASGYSANALGYNSKAYGNYSSSIGFNTTSLGFGSTVVGVFNDSLIGSSQTSVSTATPLFVVGNGDNASTKNSALAVQKNGKVYIDPSNKNDGVVTGNSLAFGTYNVSGEGIASKRTPTGNQYGLDLYTNFTPRISIMNNGNVGISTTTPVTRLDITGGNNWDLSNTEGDVRIGNSTYRLKFGVALGGGGAGAATIMQYGANGGFNALTLGSQGIGIMTLFGSTGNVGIGTTNASERLTVAGNICATGFIGSCSDIRYKTNILPVSHALSSLLAIHGIYYNWKQEYKDKGFTDARQIGFSAQEVEQQFPEMVMTDKAGYKAVDYSRMAPVIVEAIKEQQQQIQEQQKEIDQMKADAKKKDEMLDDQQKDIEMLKKQVDELLKRSK